MNGKKAIITGPTSGIGKEIAIQLAAMGADIVLACRDINRGRQTAVEIARLTGSENCEVMQIDTSSQKSIREFAGQYRKKYSRLDVLVNNAGIYRLNRETGVDGIELTFATNVLGYYLLTNELLDLIKVSTPARIVNVASTFATDPDFTDLQFEHRPYKGQEAYSQSKACNRMFTWALTRRLDGSGVTANTMSPGFVMTEIYRDVTPGMRIILNIVKLFFGKSITQGADTAVWLASSPEVEGVTGKFYEKRREVPCQFRSIEAEEKLWRICEDLTGTG
jgi:NAD(P)-dependent dehydrogenase (short-subunit alcohol dehydrogenase family)